MNTDGHGFWGKKLPPLSMIIITPLRAPALRVGVQFFANAAYKEPRP